MRVKYVSTEEFTNDFINSLRDDRKASFKRSYRDIDVLLVDDIQFIEGKEGIQEEFFHTFNTLHNANKQIVISSDRPPKQLATLEDRLRTRFEWGLITDVQPPELETRIAILRKKAQMDRLDVPDDVLELIASSIERNIRELEGALIRVTAFASLNKTPIDKSLAEIVLRDLISDASTMQISTADDHGRHRRVLRDHRRGAARARQDPGPGPVPPDRDVSVPRAHRPLAAQDRPGVRPRPHHRHVRREEDPRRDGRAPRGLRSRQGTHDADPSALQALTRSPSTFAQTSCAITASKNFCDTVRHHSSHRQSLCTTRVDNCVDNLPSHWLDPVHNRGRLPSTAAHRTAGSRPQVDSQAPARRSSCTNYPFIPSFHSPYYCYLSISLDFSLEEKRLGTPRHHTVSRHVVEPRLSPRSISFQVGAESSTVGLRQPLRSS